MTDTATVEAQAAEAQAAQEAAAAEQQQEAAPSWYNTYLGVDNEDAATQKLEYYKGLEQQADALKAKEQDYESKLSLFSQVEKDPDPELVVLESMKSKGIPLKTATQILDSTREDLLKNPLEALILAEAVKNPDKFKQMGRAKIEQALRDTYNLEESGEYTPSARMESDAFDAISAIEKTKADVAEIKNPITFAKENQAKAQAAIEQRQTLALTELQRVSESTKEVSYKYGEKSIALQVSKDEIDKVFETQKAYLGAAFDVSTKEGKQALQSYVESQVIQSKLLSGELMVEWEKSYAAEVARSATQEALNGKSKEVDRAEQDGAKKELSPIARVALAEGKTLPKSLQ